MSKKKKAALLVTGITEAMGKASLKIMVPVVLAAVLLTSVGYGRAITNSTNVSSSISMHIYDSTIGDNFGSLNLSHHELDSSCPPAHIRITYPQNDTRVGNITKVTGALSGSGILPDFGPRIYVDGMFIDTARIEVLSFKGCWQGHWWLYNLNLSKGYHTLTAEFAPLNDSVTIECAPPKKIHVNASFEDDPANHKWNTIQEGIKDATKGVKNTIDGIFVDVRDTILVDAGTYSENVVLDRPVILRRNKTGTPVVNSGRNGDAIRIIADNCIVEGFKVTGSGINEGDAGIKVTSKNNVIRNNIASGSKHGILLIKASDNLLSDNNVSSNYAGIKLNLSNNNTVTNNVALTNSMYGFVLRNSGENELLHNTANSNNGGVTLLNSDSNTLSCNAVSSNKEGIYLFDSHENTISDNNCINFNEAKGLKLDNSSGNTINTNFISNNPIGAELKSSNSNIVSVNVISSNNDYGILLRNTSTNNTIWDNNISGNGCGICLKSSNNLVYYNNFIDNINSAYDNAGTNSWNKNYPFGNFWSDYHGVDNYCGINQDQPGSDGIGDASYSILGNAGAKDKYPYMDANGWLISPFLVAPSKIDTNVKQHQCIAQVIAIINRGNRTIQILSIKPDVNWIYVNIPPLFLNSLEPESLANFIVSGDTKNLSEGCHEATLSIKTNLGTENVSINLCVESWRPVIEIDPKIVINGMLCGQKALIKPMLINPSDESLSVNVSSDSPWIEIEESRSEIKPHSTKQIEVALYKASQGAHIGYILINTKNEIWRIPVGIFVSDKSSLIESCCGRVDIAEFESRVRADKKIKTRYFSIPPGLDQMVFANIKLSEYSICELRLYGPDEKCVYSSRKSGHTSIDNPKAGPWRVVVELILREHTPDPPNGYTVRVRGHVTSYIGTIPVIITGNLQHEDENQSYEFSVPSGLKRLVLEHTGNDYYLYDSEGNYIYSENKCTVVDNPKAGIWKIVVKQTHGGSYEAKIYGYDCAISHPGSIPFIANGNLKMQGDEQEYEFSVPSGLNQLVFTHTGSDCISYLYDTEGNCIYSGSKYTIIDNPKTGIWKIVVERTSSYSGSYEVKVYGRSDSYLESIPIIIHGTLQHKYENQTYKFSVPSGLNQLVFRHNNGDALFFHLYDPDGDLVYSHYKGTGYGRINEPKAGTWKVVVYAHKGRSSYEVKIYGHAPSYVGSIPVIIGGKPQKVGENQSYEFSVPSGLNQLSLRHTGDYFDHRFYFYDPDGKCVYADRGSGNIVLDYPKDGIWKIIVLAWSSHRYEINIYGRAIQYVESIPAIVSGMLFVCENQSYAFSVPSGLDQLVFDYFSRDYGGYMFYLYNPNGECMYHDRRESITIDNPKTGIWETLVEKTSSKSVSYEMKAYPSDNRLEITLSPSYWDAGELQENETKSNDFTIKNTGENTTKIEYVTSNTSWIEIKGDFNKNLAPDETLTFTVSVSSHNLSAGRYERLVTIKTDKGCYIFLVTVEVRKPRTDIVQDSLEISLFPSYWDAGNLRKTKSQSFTIKNTGVIPIKLENVTANANWIEITGDFNQTLLPDNTTSFTVNVSFQNLSAGRYEGFIIIETDRGNYISQVFMEVGRPKVKIMPPSINIAPIRRNESLYFAFNIINAGNSDLTIDNVSSAADLVTIEELSKNKIGPGEISKLTINVLYSEIGAHSGLISINTDAGDYQIPVFVVIERMTPTKENELPIASFRYSPENPVVNETIIFNASLAKDPDGFIEKYEWEFGDGNIGTGEVVNHSYSSAGSYNVILTVTDDDGAANSTFIFVKVREKLVFDTGAGTYPSIMGVHNGTITPSHNVVVNKMYTYACEGTSGHTEYVEIHNKTFYINATWNGYQSDYHNITFPQQFTLLANHRYNYTIITGSYPQMIHVKEHEAKEGGNITCSEFIDANDNEYADWIPAIKLSREDLEEMERG